MVRLVSLRFAWDSSIRFSLRFTVSACVAAALRFPIVCLRPIFFERVDGQSASNCLPSSRVIKFPLPVAQSPGRAKIYCKRNDRPNERLPARPHAVAQLPRKFCYLVARAQFLHVCSKHTYTHTHTRIHCKELHMHVVRVLSIL